MMMAPPPAVIRKHAGKERDEKKDTEEEKGAEPKTAPAPGDASKPKQEKPRTAVGEEEID
jgi:hypothetical protein